MQLYRSKLRCLGLTANEGGLAPKNILEGFSHRPWHTNVACSWDGESLWLVAENDFDADGNALLDEFWDEVIASVDFSSTIRFEIVEVAKLD